MVELEHNSLGIKKINLEVRFEEVRLEEGGRKMLAANLGQQALLKLGQQALLKLGQQALLKLGQQSRRC